MNNNNTIQVIILINVTKKRYIMDKSNTNIYIYMRATDRGVAREKDVGDVRLCV